MFEFRVETGIPVYGRTFSSAHSDDLRVRPAAGTHNNVRKGPTTAVDPLELDDANGGGP